MKKILIISYTFPPSKDIGGRRWAKFAKYFDRAGYDVCVLASDLGEDEKSPWQTDIQAILDQGKVNYIQNGYPSVLDKYPSSLSDKIKYRIALQKVKRDVKGNYYDRSFYWQKKMFEVLKEKLEQGYDTVLATGAPFQYLYYLTNLFPDYPDVKFIADIRDPWANNKTVYSFDSLSDKRQREVLFFEQQVMSRFDHVITVSAEITSYFQKRSLGKTLFHTISNGYDSDDFENLALGKKPKSDTISFVLTGSLYDKAIHIFEKFTAGLKQLKTNNPAVFNSLRFDFYGRPNHTYKHFFEDPILKDTILHHGLVDISEVYQKINNADVCLIFLTDDLTYSKSTKFFEYIALKKKIAVFSNPGGTGAEVEKHKIGYAIHPDDIENSLTRIYNDGIVNNLSFPTEFDPSRFQVKNLLDDIIDIIEQ